MTTTKNITFEQNVNAFKELVKDAPTSMSDLRIAETLICDKTKDCSNCIFHEKDCNFNQINVTQRLNFIAGTLTELGVML